MSLPYPLHHHPKFAFWKLEPERIYYVGGFGVQSTWYVLMSTFAAQISERRANDACTSVHYVSEPVHGPIAGVG